MKKYLTFIFAFIFLISSSPSAYANPTPLIQQGDKVLIEERPGDFAVCTIGYVDAARKNFMLTGHYTDGRVGDIVLNDNFQEIGRVSENYHDGTAMNDIAVVDVTHGNIGRNIHSGDVWVAPHTVRWGEKVCSYGANSATVHCGRIIGKELPNVLVASRNAGGIGGDSGGPAWIPGRGLIGFYSGFTGDEAIFTYPDINYGKFYVPTFDDIKRDVTNNINNGIREINKYAPQNMQVPLSSF